MGDYKVIRYSSDNFAEWNDFVSKAKNATFLFDRNFMEYHKGRFDDYSLLIYKNNNLIALLPANSDDKVIHSHQGLSYGGLILPYKIPFQTVLEALKVVLAFFLDNKFQRLIIKQIPKIYLNKPSGEMDYLMFSLKAKLFRRDISMFARLDQKIAYSTLRKRGVKKAQRFKLEIVEDDDFDSFWKTILVPNLKDTYNVAPVHSLEEITELKKKFPHNIRQFNVFDGNEILAGCTVFEAKHVAHLQYISTNKKVKKGALDYLICQLMTNVYKSKVYFDFGISNENDGKHINMGLLNWKQSFGASSLVHDFYEVELSNYTLLNYVMI